MTRYFVFWYCINFIKNYFYSLFSKPEQSKIIYIQYYDDDELVLSKAKKDYFTMSEIRKDYPSCISVLFIDDNDFHMIANGSITYTNGNICKLINLIDPIDCKI